MPLTSEVLYTSYNNFEKGQDSYFFTKQVCHTLGINKAN